MVMEQHSFDSYIRIICSNVSIVIKQRAERLRKAYLKINIQNRNGCPYDLGITSHGAVKINNDAREGRIVYTFPEVTVFRSNFTKSTERRTIVCKSGYNIILVMTSCCESIPHILKKRAPWFDPFNVQIIENPDVLIVDLTFLIDTIKHFKKNYTIDIVLSIGELDATLNVFAMYWDDNSTDRYLIGTVTLESNLIDDRLYKKIRIMAKSNFVLTRDSTDLLKVVPLPIVICPLSPVVVLDRHTVQENQVILFNDRLLPNYDLVKLDNSTLLITDVVSNAAKGLII
uniref:Uncharacterized protein n=1 Tax=Romanomermis culicivorax TaxID=13658 RepID=A0A915IPU6_ROMCU